MTASTLRTADITALATGGVIRRAEVEQMREATGIVAQAKAEAEEIRSSLADVVATEKGKGFQEGQQEGARAVAAAMTKEHAQLHAALDQLEVEVAGLVSTCLRQILGEIDQEMLITRVVSQALDGIRAERKATLYVAPSAVEQAHVVADAALADYPMVEFIDVVADPILAAPDLRLESDLGVVSFVLDDTLADLKNLLTGHN